ncbi:MAG: hypothetical protein GYB31_03210 [Bacteroidetes bacterium]|nr:hypothetical protein [Bacteroidota bacterium]
MSTRILVICCLVFCFFLGSISNIEAPSFKYKKKLEKHVFKEANGRLNYDLQFDESDQFMKSR